MATNSVSRNEHRIGRANSGGGGTTALVEILDAQKRLIAIGSRGAIEVLKHNVAVNRAYFGQDFITGRDAQLALEYAGPPTKSKAAKISATVEDLCTKGVRVDAAARRRFLQYQQDARNRGK